MWKTAGLSDQRLAQQQRKGLLQLRALTDVGIDAMVPGQGDLALGVDWLKEQAAAVQAPYTAANLVCDGERLFPPSRTVEVAELDVLVVGVLSENDQVPERCQVMPAAPAIQAALDAEPTADLVVMLSRMDNLADEALAEAVPGIDLIVGGGSKGLRPEPQLLPERTARVEAGSRGKKLGIASVEWNPSARGFSLAGAVADLEAELAKMQKRRQSAVDHVARATSEKSKKRQERRVEYYNEQIPKLQQELADARASSDQPGHTLSLELRGLGADIVDHAATAARLEQALSDIESMETRGAGGGPLRGPYMGSGACAGCHTEQYAQWKTTPHAHAWQTLVDQKRHMDLDCFTCHVTGAFHPEGPQHPNQVGQLKDVGCESCHGPGRDHVGAPAPGQMVKSPPVSTCTQCHDGAQDEGRFDYATYLPKVVHGTDTPGAGSAPTPPTQKE